MAATCPVATSALEGATHTLLMIQQARRALVSAPGSKPGWCPERVHHLVLLGLSSHTLAVKCREAEADAWPPFYMITAVRKR